jgi:hypothetical protein
MKQSSVIAFALIIAFIVFITLRGELSHYLGVFGLGSTSSGNNPAGSLNTLSAGLPSLLNSTISTGAQ